MSSDLSEWTDTVWRVLSCLPAASQALANPRRRWEHFLHSGELRIVIFGAYDAGKSTLLKRLLVESGTGVPEWLTVSGRRETFEVQSIKSEGIVFVDTPGLSGGNDEHERVSLDAMQLADAYLWILPPQLITANEQVLIEFASGRHFGDHLPASIVAGATIAAIARMDEVGIDPEDNPDGFRELATRKTAELRSMLYASGVGADLRAVMCVSADPYQMVGTNSAPEPDSYDHGRDWDGVEALTHFLCNLCSERESLRAGAGARFVAGLARDAREILKNKIAEDEYSLEALGNEIEHLRLSEQRLNSLRRQAAADLHRRVEEELLHASRIGAESAADVAQTLEDSLSSAVNEWSDSFFDDYRRLAEEVDLEVRERLARPGFAEFRRLHDSPGEDADAAEHGQHVDGKRIFRRALGFGPELRKALDVYARSKLGIDLRTAAGRLQEIEHSGQTVSDFIKARGRQASFRSVTEAGKASRLVSWGRTIDAVGPLVVQLGDLVFDAADGIMTAQRAKERAQRRSDLMEKIRQETGDIEKQATANFDRTCDKLQQWISNLITTFQDRQADLKRQIKELRDGALRIDQVLHSFPSET